MMAWVCLCHMQVSGSNALEMHQQLEQQKQNAHAEKQQRRRGHRQVDLENVLERLQQENEISGAYPWRAAN